MVHLDLKKNVGATDRTIRALLGLMLLGLVLARVVTGWWAVAAAALSLSEFFTAYSGY